MATMNSIDSSKGRLRGTYIAIMIPLGVAINYVGGQIASSLGLPIYLDSIGTVIVAAIMGPWVGAISGALYNIISALIGGNILGSLFAIAILVQVLSWALWRGVKSSTRFRMCLSRPFSSRFGMRLSVRPSQWLFTAVWTAIPAPI